MRNPNGYGSVIKLKGNRRRPFMVRKTRGWNDKGHPIYDIIGYYATRKEAMLALADYNSNPYDVAQANMTVAELYERWLIVKAPLLGKSSQRNLKSAFNVHAKSLYNFEYVNIRSFHIQELINNCSAGSSVKSIIRNLFCHLDNFAFEIDLINKRYANLVKVQSEPPKTEKRIFTNDEIKQIKQNQNDIFDVFTLILLYTGLRISELINLKKENVNIKEWYFRAGLKTSAGKNRIIPIHSCLKSAFLKLYNTDNKQFFNFNHQTARNKIKERYNHIPHEARHTVRTLLARKNGDKICIDRIMGHVSSNTGDSVYTHKTLEELRETIELLD